MGVSTLNKWIKVAQDNEDASLPDADLVREVERLRKENAVLKQEREILKKDETFVRHWFKNNGRMPSLRVKSNEICIY